MQNIKSVIFDLDGTLIDSMWMWGEVAEKFLLSRGATPRPGFRATIRALNTVEEAQYYINEYGVDLPLEDVITGRDDLMLEFLSRDVELKAGTMPVLKALQERDIKMCIATATERRLAEPVLKLYGIMDFFERIFICSEENTSKSSPDMFIRAAEFLGTDIGCTLVVEDILNAMETAKRAGFIVAGVYDKASDDQQNEIKALCDYYWKYPGEMLEYL